ncbi:MAG: prolipoprotein diacylglyceryl transferase family protein [Patescibacteria group bacterium]
MNPFLINGFIYCASLLIAVFFVWYESKLDGFDEDQIFDFIFLTLIVGFLSGRFVFALSSNPDFWEALKVMVYLNIVGLSWLGFFSGSFAGAIIWIRLKKWSFYRLFDALSIGFGFGLAMWEALTALVTKNYMSILFFGLSLLVLALCLLLRRKKYVFGLAGGLILASFPLIIILNFANKDALNMESLIFSVILITLGLGILFIRLRSARMKVSRGFSTEFLKNVKNLLLSKDKELAKEENLLIKEDPYLKPDRDVMNNEDVDEAKEDEAKETTDILSRSVREMRMQIKKALAKINIGTYGICEVCHKPIDEARLRAFPQATMCTRCAEKKE